MNLFRAEFFAIFGEIRLSRRRMNEAEQIFVLSLGPTLRPAELQAAHADGVVKRVRQHIWHVDRSPAEKGRLCRTPLRSGLDMPERPCAQPAPVGAAVEADDPHPLAA